MSDQNKKEYCQDEYRQLLIYLMESTGANKKTSLVNFVKTLDHSFSKCNLQSLRDDFISEGFSGSHDNYNTTVQHFEISKIDNISTGVEHVKYALLRNKYFYQSKLCNKLSWSNYFWYWGIFKPKMFFHKKIYEIYTKNKKTNPYFAAN